MFLERHEEDAHWLWRRLIRADHRLLPATSILPRLECAAELVGERSEPLRRRGILAFGVLAHFLGLVRVQDRLER